MSCYEFEDVRYIRGRHFAECGGEDGCAGCLRCTERHCPECRKGAHLGFGENTCPACIGKARANLRAILELYAALPAEAEEKGVESSAFVYSTPAGDPEAWQWRRAAAALDGQRLAADPTVAVTEQWSARRIGRARGAKDSQRLNLDPSIASSERWSRERRGWAASWISDEHHPLTVLGTWVRMLGEDYGDEWTGEITVAGAVDYLDVRLGRIAHDVGQDFGQFRQEIARCRAHLEAVLHDGEQRDTGAPCMTCSVPLQRVWGSQEAEDGWRCPKCHQTSTEAQYRFAVQHLHREEATELTAYDLEIRTGVPASTIRRWASKTFVRGEEVAPRLRASGRDVEGRKMYRVADVQSLNRKEAS